MLCMCFQGGYNLTSLAQSVCQTVHTLLGDPAPRLANLDGPCKRSVSLSVMFRHQMLMCVCVCCSTPNALCVLVLLRPFSVSDQLIDRTGPASNMQV